MSVECLQFKFSISRGFYLTPERAAEFCDQLECMIVCFYISKTICQNITHKFFVVVTCGSGLIIL